MKVTPDFDARAKDIVNGYGYLCADRMNDCNILQFASIVSAALLQAFEEGKLLCQATVTAGGTASSAPVEPLQTDVGGNAQLGQYGETKSDQAYQVIGTLASIANCFDDPEVQRALDYFSEDGFDPKFLPFKRPRQIEEPEHREGDEPDPQVETLA